MKVKEKKWLETAKTPEEVGVSSKVLQEFVDACMEKNKELHSFMVIRHGKIACEVYREPLPENISI